MKRFALALFLVLAPAVHSTTVIEPEPKSQILNNPFERLGKEAKFNCKDFGDDSCFSRFIAMSACAFAQSINSDKTVKESLDISDDLFYLLASGHGLKINNIFDEKDLIKQDIRVESIERIKLCKEWAREAIPRIVLERTGKPATPEFIEGATSTFGEWWMRSLEGVRKNAIKN